MHLFNFGINHRTAPVNIREQTAFAPDKLVTALADITDTGGAREARYSQPAIVQKFTAVMNRQMKIV